MLAMQSTLLVSVASAQAPDAKASLASGDKAARAKDWAKAQADYEAANAAAPSADALDGLANAHYQQKHDAEAYAAYESWLKTYGTTSPAKKRAAEARLVELGSRTSLLLVESTESGAKVEVDDKPVGTTPLAAPLRLALGPHRLRVTKDGFVPFDQAPNVAAGTTTPVQVKLEAQSTKGRLSVREKSGKAIRVLVDGVDMGEAPWAGDVEAGPHEISGRSGPMTAAPEKVTVERGKTKDVELVASASYATLKVGTSDGKGLVYLDDKLVGEGTFTSDVPSGPHSLRITREGYDPFEETIELKDKETLARTITLKLSSKIETGPVQKENRPLEGIYGGFGLLMTFLPGGMNSAMQKTCEGRSARGARVLQRRRRRHRRRRHGVHRLPLGSGRRGALPRRAVRPDVADAEVGAFLDRPRLRSRPGAYRGVQGAARRRLRSAACSPHATGREAPVQRGRRCRPRVPLAGPHARHDAGLGRRARRARGGRAGLSLAGALDRAEPPVPARTAHRDRARPLGARREPARLRSDPDDEGRERPRVLERPRGPPSGLTTPAYELASGTQVFIGPFIGMMFGP